MRLPLDELFGYYTPTEVDVIKTDKFFDDTETAIKYAVKDTKYSEDEQCKDSINNIENEFYWFYDKYKKLLSSYEETLSLLEYYRNEVESRLNSEEVFELNSIKVRNKLEISK